jgi:hypothetical protein
MTKEEADNEYYMAMDRAWKKYIRVAYPAEDVYRASKIAAIEKHRKAMMKVRKK